MAEPKFQYLVVLSHSLDDVPIRLLDDSDEAIKFAEDTDWKMMGTPLSGTLDLPDMNTPANVNVVTFRDGIPCSRVIVKEYDDDDEF